MTAVFVHVPEHQAGSPVSIAAAVQHLAGVSVVLTARWPDGPAQVVWGWLFLRSGLGAGIPAYVRSPSSGRYARIPPEYWSDVAIHDEPPATFLGLDDAVGADLDMVGEPLVMWEGDLEPLVGLIVDFSKAMTPGDASPDPKDIGRHLGRPKDTSPYPRDAEMVERVIAMCDAGRFQGPARVTNAVTSLLPEIDGQNLDRSDDPARVRRVREKVLKKRPDLRT